MNIEEYFKWLREATRSPSDIEARWKAVGIVIPLKRWREICNENDGLTVWGDLVECELSLEEGNLILGLDYYEHVVKKSDAHRIYNGLLWKGSVYSITISGIEPSHEKEFETIEHVKNYVKDRVEWATSDTSFHNPFCNFSCNGFTLSEVGIDWKERVA